MSNDCLKQRTSHVLNHYHDADSVTVAEMIEVRLSWNFDGKPSPDELVFLNFRGSADTTYKVKKDSLLDLACWMLKQLNGSALAPGQREEVLALVANALGPEPTDEP